MGGCGLKIKLIQTFTSVFVTCKDDEDPSKMKVLERSQQISNCKSMQVFYEAQGKLAPQSEVGFTLSSNSTKLLCMSLFPAKM